jgi:hypothetical protein
LSANGQNLKGRSRRSKKQQQSLTPGLTFQNNVQINVEELSDEQLAEIIHRASEASESGGSPGDARPPEGSQEPD